MKKNTVNVILALVIVLSLILPLSGPVQAGASPGPALENPVLNYEYSIKFMEERPLEKGQESIVKTPQISHEIPQDIEISSVSRTINFNASFLSTISGVYGVKSDDILAYYRGLGLDPNKVETADLLRAADDWIANVIPPGFTNPITTAQLLFLADEWLLTPP